MLNFFLITLGKLLSALFRLFNLGSGSTWPGHIALSINKHFIKDLLKNSDIKIILIAGTNGKTTTSKLIQTALTDNGKKVLQNDSGANLLNGIASTFLLHTNLKNVILSKRNASKDLLQYDYAIFEVDENTLPKLLQETTPDYVVLLNLFRDQLDRYGEVNTIINNWKVALTKLPKETTLVLNADDPQIAYLGLSVIPAKAGIQNSLDPRVKPEDDNILFFGLQPSQFGNDKLQHAADSVYCPKCGEKLTFAAIAFSHLGDWHCKKCGLKKPHVASVGFTIYPLPGLYNKYNVQSAKILLKHVGLTDEQINDAFTNFEPAFGRQEIITYKNKNIQVFLSKNPTSFNQSYTTIQELEGKTVLFVLNDRIPDGRDVSWIWDIDLPNIEDFKHILIAGDRVYDMAIRLKYESEGQKSKVKSQNLDEKIKTFENLKKAIDEGVKLINEDEILFILPTYSAMLETRKIITGKKIL